MEENIYQKGLAKHRELFGHDPAASIETVEALSPDVAKLLVETLYGAILTRPGLEPKIRQFCTIAALTATGKAPQLKAHVKAARRLGATEAEIMEILIQMVGYAGWPSALTAITVAKEAFAEFNENG
jgi:4-carboxymuconolactone decarboxylase